MQREMIDLVFSYISYFKIAYLTIYLLFISLYFLGVNLCYFLKETCLRRDLNYLRVLDYCGEKLWIQPQKNTTMANSTNHIEKSHSLLRFRNFKCFSYIQLIGDHKIHINLKIN